MDLKYVIHALGKYKCKCDHVRELTSRKVLNLYWVGEVSAQGHVHLSHTMEAKWQLPSRDSEPIASVGVQYNDMTSRCDIDDEARKYGEVLVVLGLSQ